MTQISPPDDSRLDGSRPDDSRQARSSPSRFWAAVAASVAAVSAVVVVLLASGDTEFAHRFIGVATVVAAIVAVGSCHRAAVRGGPEARGWWLLGISVVVWGSAEFLMLLNRFFTDGLSAMVAIAGIGFLGYAGPAVAALLAFQRTLGRQANTLRGIVDAMVIALSVAFTSWVFVLGPVFRTSNTSWSLALLGLLYPIVDVALVALLFVLAMRRTSGSRQQWTLLACGLLLIAVTDATFLIQSIGGSLAAVDPLVGVGWLTAMVLIALAPLTPVKRPDPERLFAPGYTQSLTAAQELAPYIPLGLAFAAAWTVDIFADPFLVSCGVAIVGLLTVRQVMIVREKDALHRELLCLVTARTSELVLAQTDLRQTFDNAPIGMLWLTMAGSIAQVNAVLCDMVGRTHDELVGSTLDVIKFPADIPASRKMIGDAAAATEEFRRTRQETRYRHSDGRVIWTELSLFLTRDTAGAPKYLVAQIQDVTSRRSAARALANQSSLLEAVLENLDSGVIACDAEGQITLFNRASREFLGAPSPGVGDERWVDHQRAHQVDGSAVPTGAFPVFRADGVTLLPRNEIPLVRALAGENVRNAELVVTECTGDQRIIIANGRSLADAEGTPLGAVVTMHDITGRRKAEAALSRQALHDPLTDLANRALLRDRLEHAIARRSRRPEPLALLLMDLDGFKVVNDSLGHQAGDEVLVSIAGRLRGCLRPDDTIARLGGDEFAVVLENTSEAQATRIAEQILATVRQPVSTLGRSISSDASIGVMIGTESDTPESLLRNADLAMYAAKDSGKGNVRVFKAAMYETVLKRLVLDEELREAIDKHEFVLVYQPIVSLVTGHLQGFEALVRWDHPDRGLIPPATFIPLAEATGLILPLGRWVLREACRQAGKWGRSIPGAEGLMMAVNLSVRQLQDPAIVADVAAALADAALPPDRLHLEITESVFDFRAQIPFVLNKLHQTGLQLVMDDFGTGYSSLSRLHSLPIDKVKIDKSFVDMLAGGGPAPMVAATIAMAHSLGLQTVAEGVETADQLPFLLHYHCDEVQGYLFSRPLAAADVVDLLKRCGTGKLWRDLLPFGAASDTVDAVRKDI